MLIYFVVCLFGTDIEKNTKRQRSSIGVEANLKRPKLDFDQYCQQHNICRHMGDAIQEFAEERRNMWVIYNRLSISFGMTFEAVLVEFYFIKSFSSEDIDTILCTDGLEAWVPLINTRNKKEFYIFAKRSLDNIQSMEQKQSMLLQMINRFHIE